MSVRLFFFRTTDWQPAPVNAVGGLNTEFSPGSLVLPNQIIDYTYDRQHTFFDENLHSVTHIDF